MFFNLFIMSESEKKTEQKQLEEKKKRSALREAKEEYMNFLGGFSIISMALGVIIGGSVNTLVQSLITGVFTPLLQLIVPLESFKDLSFTYNGVVFHLGPLITALLNFIFVSLIIFYSIKFIIFKGGTVDKTKL